VKVLTALDRDVWIPLRPFWKLPPTVLRVLRPPEANEILAPTKAALVVRVRCAEASSTICS
jgi:hypothetical protein